MNNIVTYLFIKMWKNSELVVVAYILVNVDYNKFN